MSFSDNFDIIAFRSRNYALWFSSLMREAGFANQIISTPKEIAMGCGLSVKFSPYITPRVIQLYNSNKCPIVGFYHMERISNMCRLIRISHE